MKRTTLRDLVREAGVNLPDWQSASNPKYCYNWGFTDGQNAVLTQWYKDIHQERSRVYCEVVPAEVWREFSDWNGHQKKRFQQVIDILEQFAVSQEPIRVVIVSGVNRFKASGKPDVVEKRIRDPIMWRVTRMENRPGFVIEREFIQPVIKNPGLDDPIIISRKLTRLAYNCSDWRRPTGEAATLEAKDSYVVEMGFGHEEWLFRNEWTLDGWRYGFLQGAHKGAAKRQGSILDVDLFTFTPEKAHRMVAHISNLECLSEAQAVAVLEEYRELGWLDQMVEEVQAVGGDHIPLLNPTTAWEMFNIRFKLSDVVHYPEDAPLPAGVRPEQLKRYLLMDLDKRASSPPPSAASRRQGRDYVPPPESRTRHPGGPVTYTPEHQNMQRKLMEELKEKYGEGAVLAEQDLVDVRVETETELIYFEIKTELDPRLVIRQALGQILEYAYYPGRGDNRLPTKLVVVGRKTLDQDSEAYLRTIARFIPIPLEYLEITL